MEQTTIEAFQQRAHQLRKAAITLVVIVAAQVVALEVVLRGWQAMEATTVFVGIGVSARLCALSLIIFFLTPRKSSQ